MIAGEHAVGRLVVFGVALVLAGSWYGRLVGDWAMLTGATLVGMGLERARAIDAKRAEQ
jgi:hypothetical protein